MLDCLTFTPTHTDSILTVCSGLDNTCRTLNTKVDLGVIFHNELLNNNDTIDLSPVILKETPVDMIIGRDTIKKYKLFEKIPSQLSSDCINHDDLEVVEGTNRCACQLMRDSTKPSLIAQTETLIVTSPHRLLSSLIPMSQNILGGSLPDDDEIDHDKTDTFKPWLRQPDISDVLSQIKISGDEDLQHKIRT